MIHLDGENHGHHSAVDGDGRSGDVAVEALTLDEYLAGRHGEIGLVKIDVEGAEGHVLAGMRATLRGRAIRNLISSNSIRPRSAGAASTEAVLRNVLAAGYRRPARSTSGREPPCRSTSPGRSPLIRRLEAGGVWTDLVFERTDR